MWFSWLILSSSLIGVGGLGRGTTQPVSPPASRSLVLLHSLRDTGRVLPWLHSRIRQQVDWQQVDTVFVAGCTTTLVFIRDSTGLHTWFTNHRPVYRWELLTAARNTIQILYGGRKKRLWWCGFRFRFQPRTGACAIIEFTRYTQSPNQENSGSNNNPSEPPCALRVSEIGPEIRLPHPYLASGTRLIPVIEEERITGVIPCTERPKTHCKGLESIPLHIATAPPFLIQHKDIFLVPAGDTLYLLKNDTPVAHFHLRTPDNNPMYVQQFRVLAGRTLHDTLVLIAGSQNSTRSYLTFYWLTVHSKRTESTHHPLVQPIATHTIPVHTLPFAFYNIEGYGFQVMIAPNGTAYFAEPFCPVLWRVGIQGVQRLKLKQAENSQVIPCNTLEHRNNGRNLLVNLYRANLIAHAIHWTADSQILVVWSTLHKQQYPVGGMTRKYFATLLDWQSEPIQHLYPLQAPSMNTHTRKALEQLTGWTINAPYVWNVGEQVYGLLPAKVLEALNRNWQFSRFMRRLPRTTTIRIVQFRLQCR